MKNVLYVKLLVFMCIVSGVCLVCFSPVGPSLPSMTLC